MQKAYVQYSKKIATYIAIFWGVFRILILVLVYLRPEMIQNADKLLSGVDDVMMVSVGFYTGNSVIEKGITGYFSAKGAKDDGSADDESGNG